MLHYYLLRNFTCIFHLDRSFAFNIKLQLELSRAIRLSVFLH